MPHPKAIAYCSLATLVALYVVGAVSNGSLRHEVQTLPLWFPIALGFRQRDLAKWTALPCFIIWLTLMIFIWLFLLGWARIISGHFSPVEIAMTLIVGIACAAGIGIGFRWRTAMNWALFRNSLSALHEWLRSARIPADNSTRRSPHLTNAAY